MLLGENRDGKENKESRDFLRRMLLSYRDYYGNYHNHKENMAWIATVFYVGVIGGSLKLVSACDNCVLKLSACIIVILFSFLIGNFVRQQLESRYNAHCVVRACSICIVNLSDPTDPRFDIPKNVKTCGDSLFPQFLQDEINIQKNKAKDPSIKIFECTKYTILLSTAIIAIIVLIYQICF
jgi:hypothetical protein